MQIRYIRDFVAGPSGNHWIEIQAFSQGANVAAGKPVTHAGTAYAGSPANVTDENFSVLFETTGANPSWVQIDLGELIDVEEIKVWHYYQDGRTYNGTKTEVSTDGAAWDTVFDSAVSGTYAESAGGNIIPLAAAEPPTGGSTVDWIEPQGVVIEGGTLRKTGGVDGWNAGAQSSQQTSGDPFTIEFTARTTNERIAFGLDEGRDTIEYTNKSIDFCWEINPDGLNEINVREVNQFRGTYAAGDVFQVRFENQTITFLQNDIEVHVFNSANDFPYFADCSIYKVDDTFTPTLYTPFDIELDYVGKAKGDANTDRYIYYTGNEPDRIPLDQILTKSEPNAGYAGISYLNDGSPLSLTTTTAGIKIQYCFMMKADRANLKKIQFLLYGYAGQPFTLRAWNHVLGDWDINTEVPGTGNLNEFAQLTIENNLTDYLDANDYIYFLSITNETSTGATFKFQHDYAKLTKTYLESPAANFDFESTGSLNINLGMTAEQVYTEGTPLVFESTGSLTFNLDITAEQVFAEGTPPAFESTGSLNINLDITASQTFAGETANSFESTASLNLINLDITAEQAHIAETPGTAFESTGGLILSNLNITAKQIYKEVIPTPEPAGPYVYERAGAAIYIFDRDEVLQVILSNDKQESCPLIEAKMTEELNGPFTLEFEIPADHEQAELVQEDFLAAAKDKEGNWQLFFIRELVDSHSTEWTRRAFCQHSIVELEDTIIEDFFVDRKDAPTTLEEILFGTRWELGTSQTHSEVHDLTVKYKTALEAYTKFLERWRVEARYRIQIAGQTITKRYIDIYSQRGTDTGKRFEYDKDMSEIIRTIDTSTIKTALYGLGKENEAGNPLTFTAINGGYPYVVDEAARTKWGLQLAGGTKGHRWGIFSDSNIEDATTLRAATVAALDVVKNPLLTYQMKVIDITEIAGVPHEAVSLGLTITAIDRDLKIQEKARCIKQVTDLLNENFSEITLGNFLPSQTKSTQSQLQEIADRAASAAAAAAGALTAGAPISTAWLEGEINALNNAITAGSGTVTVTEDQGILVENIPKTQAIRLLGGVLAIANSKNATTGLYDWRTFGTGDGFVADQITSGSMLFDRARGGTLLLGGTNNANGRLLVYDKEGNVVGDLDAATGGFHELYVGEFRADNVLNSNFKTIVYSVHPDTGDDNNDGLTSDTALRRVQEAISRIPRHNNGRVEIYVKNVVFNEFEIKVEGFFGNGTIAIYFNGAQHNGMIYVRNNNQTVELYGGKINQIYGTQYFRDGTITVQRTHSVYMKDMQVYSRRNVDFGVKVQAAYCLIESCNFYDATTAGVNADFGGVVDMTSDNYGSGAWAGIRAVGTGRIATHGSSVPAGTIETEVIYGGEIIGSRTHAVGTPSVLEAPPITTFFTATNLLSWNTKKGWQSENNYIYQGEWSDTNSWGVKTYYGNYKGCFWFNNAAIATAISGRTVLSARIRLKRLTIGGLSLPTQANLWTITTPISGIGAGEPAVDFNIGGGTTYRWGEEDAIGIPAWIITGLANNSYGGFALYNAGGLNYMIFASEATLEITYQ